jgi:hypothetical protein
MKANETTLTRIFEGTKQYVVPHFQRPYTWQRTNWETLWLDLAALIDSAVDQRIGHFMGAIVTAPASSVPEGVTKYLLIDGQQRLTTLLVVLAAVRDRARKLGESRFADEIQNLYLTNQYQDGIEQYKLLPTEGTDPACSDRRDFFHVLVGESSPGYLGGDIHKAHQYFGRMVRRLTIEQLRALKSSLLGGLILVSIVLERDDNPYCIFESLNAKGQPLSQADLVRNFFFMSIDSSRHEQLYAKKWAPMEHVIGRDSMESYIRHFLIRRGTFVKESDVYFTLKREVDRQGIGYAESMLDALVTMAAFYVRLIEPTQEPDQQIRIRLTRLQRLRATVCYPFLLNMYEALDSGRIGPREFCGVLDAIENFIIRRYVCGTMRAELNEVFTALQKNAQAASNVVEGVRTVLGSRNYPSDLEFSENLQSRRLYAAGEARDRVKLILERLEVALGSKEQVLMEDLAIEHVMPQTLTPWWRSHLGPDADDVHELLLHTLGNLTLTGYNTELSNMEFPRKASILQASSLRLNLELAQHAEWTDDTIRTRAKKLAEQAIAVWPSIAPDPGVGHGHTPVRCAPTRLFFLGKTYNVSSWEEVWTQTIKCALSEDEELVEILVDTYPKRFRTKKWNGFRMPRDVGHELYCDAYFSDLETIPEACRDVVRLAAIPVDAWRVE